MAEERCSYSLAQINQMSLLPYARIMATVFANASWVPVLAFPHRPFRNLDHLFESMSQVFQGSDESSKLQVIDQQPDLVNPPPPNEEGSEFQLFHCDRAFQTRLTPEEKLQIESLQRQYQEKFGFVLVFAPVQNEIGALIQQLQQRLEHSREQELEQAVYEASQLARHRLQELVKV